MMPQGRAGDASELDRHAPAGDPAPMHIQTLSSGSKGNATLVRAGETHLLVDVGLTLRELDESLADETESPPQRVLSRRLVAALWQPRLDGCARALLKGALGQEGTGRRLKRYAGALGR